MFIPRLMVFNTAWVLTVLGFWGSLVGFVDGVAEAEVAAAASHHVRPRAVEGHVVFIDLLHRCLKTLQRTGLLQAQPGPQRRPVRGEGFWDTDMGDC